MLNNISQAIILAGGKGSRLRPYSTILPKPLMPVGEYPILEIIVKQLQKFGIHRITFAVGYLHQLIQAYFGDGQKWNTQIAYSKEDRPLGTAGPIALVNDLSSDFIVMNGDILTTFDYSAFMKFHISTNSIATVATCNKDININLGVLELDDGTKIKDYIEKPHYSYKVSMGIYSFNSSVIKYIDKGETLDFPDLIKRLIKNNEQVRAFNFDGYWRDIGTPEDYQLALDEFEDNKDRFI